MSVAHRTFRRRLGAVICIVLATCSGSVPADFEYEPRETEPQVIRREAAGPFDVADITFASPLGGRVPVRLIKPARSQRPPVIVFQHQLGEDHHQFDHEARQLARSCGIASLLVAAPFARPRPWRSELDWRVRGRDAEIQRQAIVDLRAVLDILPNLAVDQRRVAFVGHSFGANWGGILSAVESRYGAFVLIAGLGSVTGAMDGQSPEWKEARQNLGEQGFERYKGELRPFNPDQYVRRARAGILFFQFGSRDPFITADRAREFVASASPGQLVRTYDTDHDFKDQRALLDRTGFLARQLGVRCSRPSDP